MTIAFLILLTFFAFFSLSRDRYSPLTVFLFLWIVVVALYSLKLFGIFDVRDNTLIYLYTGIFLFVIGFITGDCIFRSDQTVTLRNRRTVTIECVNVKFLNVLACLGIVASLPQVYERANYVMLAGVNLLFIKDSLITGDLSSSSILQIIFVNPISATLITSSIYFLVKDRRQKLIIFSGIWLAVTGFIFSGSKFLIVQVLICLIVVTCANRNVQDRIKKTGKRTKWFVAIGVVYIVGMMYFHSGVGIYKSIYYYLCGCIPMLDKVVNKGEFFSGLQSCYGALSFYSIVNPIDKIISGIGVDFFSDAAKRASSYLMLFERTTYAGSRVQYNAFTTFLSAPYVDFGIIGSCMLSFIYGFFTCWGYHEYKQNKNLPNTVIVSMLYVYMLTSVVRFQLSNYNLGLGLVYIIFLKNYISKSSVFEVKG